MIKKKSKRGFTLIEVIVSLAILGFIAVAFLNTFTFGLTTIFGSGNRGSAVKEAQSVLDKVYELQDFSSLDTKIDSILLAKYVSSTKYTKFVNVSDLNSTSYAAGEVVRFCVEQNIAVLTGSRQKVTILVFYKNGTQNVVLTSMFQQP